MIWMQRMQEYFTGTLKVMDNGPIGQYLEQKMQEKIILWAIQLFIPMDFSLRVPREVITKLDMSPVLHIYLVIRCLMYGNSQIRDIMSVGAIPFISFLEV